MIVNFCGIAPAAPGSFLCGSSAAVIAVMAAAGILSPDLEVRLFLFGNVRLKWLAIVCVALTFIGVGNESLGGLYAHIGGLAFGVVFALAKKKSLRIASRIPSLKNAATQMPWQTPPKGGFAIMTVSTNFLIK